MADTSTGEKTEKPSAKKLKEARQKGNVPRSADLVAALSLLAVTSVMAQFGATSLGRLQQHLAGVLRGLGDSAHVAVTPESLGLLAQYDSVLLAIIVAPLMATAAATGLAGNLVQSGWVFAPERLTPNFNKLSPANGFKRFAPSQAGVTVVKAIIAVTIVASVLWSLGQEALADTPRLAWMTPAAAATEGWTWVWRLLVRGGLALLCLAGADVGWQWWRHYQSLKMSKQELRDEAKSSDGNPEIKARVRKIQRDMTRRRMLAAVKTATVVVTNPTHFAVALEYKRGSMSAPLVVAKGQDLLAARIKEIAREHGVPIVENKPLAQALFKGAEVGDSIPGDLFGAVAEVLAYLVRIRQLMF
ncbi:MAG: flagellar biosynthesis protein FlhB [Acidobacteria bacterium]|nr:flagellar biosynthesis protein FlhB [Acidobacteriota bacterium]